MKPESSAPSSEQVRRKAYQKPRLEQVRLISEEAVLGKSCKLSTTSAGEWPPCVDPVDFSPCSSTELGS